MRAQSRELAREPEVACFDSMDEAIMGLAATWRYHRFRECGGAPESLTLPAPPAARPITLPARARYRERRPWRFCSITGCPRRPLY